MTREYTFEDLTERILITKEAKMELDQVIVDIDKLTFQDAIEYLLGLYRAAKLYRKQKGAKK